MHEGFQLDPVPRRLPQGADPVEAHFPGQDHPLASQLPVQFRRCRVHGVRLRADMDLQLRHLFVQGHDGAGIRHNGGVNADFRGQRRGSGKIVQFVVEGIAVHGHVELFPGGVGQRHGFPQLIRIKVPGEGPQAVFLHPPVDRVCSEVQRGAKRVHIAGRRKQFGDPHYRIPLSSSYFCQ